MIDYQLLLALALLLAIACIAIGYRIGRCITCACEREAGRNEERAMRNREVIPKLIRAHKDGHERGFGQATAIILQSYQKQPTTK